MYSNLVLLQIDAIRQTAPCSYSCNKLFLLLFLAMKFCLNSLPHLGHWLVLAITLLINSKCGFTNKQEGGRRAINPINSLPLFAEANVDAIFCYKCESYRDYRCLDPFDPRPHIQVNCDTESFVRDKKPVFCEKVTELCKISNT